MALPWDKVRRGLVGKGIDTAAHTLGGDAKIVKKPLIGKKASDYMSKSLFFPFKGTVIAGSVGAALGGPLAPITGPAAALKRWRSSGQIHPLFRAIGPKK